MDDVLPPLAHPPVRAVDVALTRRIATGMGGMWEGQQVAGLLAWLERYERVLRHVAVHGDAACAQRACRVLLGDWDGRENAEGAP